MLLIRLTVWAIFRSEGIQKRLGPRSAGKRRCAARVFWPLAAVAWFVAVVEIAA
jgi:hypothetical protein